MAEGIKGEYSKREVMVQHRALCMRARMREREKPWCVCVQVAECASQGDRCVIKPLKSVELSKV